MRIAVDAMDGDHAPDEIVRGALLYRAEGGLADIVLVGRDETVRAALGTTPRRGITVIDARDEPRALPAVQEPEAVAPGLPPLRHVPRPAGDQDPHQEAHTQQHLADAHRGRRDGW